jgi:hypothetical protein
LLAEMEADVMRRISTVRQMYEKTEAEKVLA